DPLSVYTGDQVHFFDDGSYDPDGGDIVLFEWDWENDGLPDETGEDNFHSWTDPGTYEVQFRVTDDEGATDVLDEPIVIEVIDETVGGWAVHAGGTDSDVGRSITTLSDGSTVVTGNFKGSATFGEGNPNETVLVSHGGDDIFLARYNPDSTLAWVTHAGGPGTDAGSGISALSDDSIGLIGWIQSTAIFGEGEPNETVLVSIASTDIFVARYNSDGTFAWANSSGGKGHDEGRGITALSDDTLAVTGNFRDKVVFGKGDPNETVLHSDGYHSDIFIARYNQDGSLIWVKRAGGNDFDVGQGISAFSDDSVVVVGHFQINGTFGNGDPNQTVIWSYGLFDSFIARYNSDGSLAWAKHSGGVESDSGLGVTTLSDDSSVVTGYFTGTATFGDGDPNETVIGSYGSNDIYIARYYSDGSLAWVKHAGGTDSDIGRGITALPDGSIVATGGFSTTATFGDSDPNETVIGSYGADDIFIARYYPDGSLAWAKHAGGTEADVGLGITSLSDNSSVMTGYFTTEATFEEGEPNETILISYGIPDIFVALYAP
ncbi:PKD domain-containing protein, partial [bacterium]|nr:PKD domain-containing protein [bacterium]